MDTRNRLIIKLVHSDDTTEQHQIEQMNFDSAGAELFIGFIDPDGHRCVKSWPTESLASFRIVSAGELIAKDPVPRQPTRCYSVQSCDAIIELETRSEGGFMPALTAYLEDLRTSMGDDVSDLLDFNAFVLMAMPKHIDVQVSDWSTGEVLREYVLYRHQLLEPKI